MFIMKFMDGTPVPEDYQKKVFSLVDAATIADVSEAEEVEMTGSCQEISRE